MGKAPTGTPAGTHRSGKGLPGLPGGSAAASPPASAGDPGGSSVWGDPTSRGTTEPMHHSSRATAPEPMLRKRNRCSEPAQHSQRGAQRRQGEKARGWQKSHKQTHLKKKEELSPWGYGTIDTPGSRLRRGQSNQGDSLAPRVWATLSLCRGSQETRRLRASCARSSEEPSRAQEDGEHRLEGKQPCQGSPWTASSSKTL